jgi:hypothetical protein
MSEFNSSSADTGAGKVLVELGNFEIIITVTDTGVYTHTGPGRTPMPGNYSGLSQTRAIERYGTPAQRGILDEGLRGGFPGSPPFWRTLI